MTGSRDENSELEDRVGVLERTVAELREQMAETRSDAAAARTLAAGADRDVSEVRAELRAHTRSLNALREVQVEQGQSIDALREELRSGFARVDSEMRAGFATVNAGMSRIVQLLSDAPGDDPA